MCDVSSILDSGAKHIIYHLSTHAKHFTHFSSIFEHFSVINFCSSFISDFRNHFFNFVDELNQISRCSFYSAHLIISCIPGRVFSCYSILLVGWLAHHGRTTVAVGSKLGILLNSSQKFWLKLLWVELSQLKSVCVTNNPIRVVPNVSNWSKMHVLYADMLSNA